MIKIKIFITLMIGILLFTRCTDPGKNKEIYRPVNVTHFISGIDFMPTILHALHLPEVENMDGTSFLPVLKGKVQKSRKAVFTEFH
ncbi:MAG TPA: hypothetical protein VK957_05325 [Lunatimonas sp.]|nr:hypothetical protein [Lunatimonas sp.]